MRTNKDPKNRRLQIQMSSIRFIETAARLISPLRRTFEYAEKSPARRVAFLIFAGILVGVPATIYSRLWIYQEHNALREKNSQHLVHIQEFRSNAATEKLSLCAQAMASKSKLKQEYCSVAREYAIRAVMNSDNEQRVKYYLDLEGYLMAESIIKDHLRDIILTSEAKSNAAQMSSYIEIRNYLPFAAGAAIIIATLPLYITMWIRYKIRSKRRWVDTI
ncbi:hypothetical protein ACP0I7_27555 [Pseudomonas aeruginosa]